ncbi:hypothetical protein FA95DRAFT_1501892, partial [Auriscalpium vulgare]
KLFGFLFNWGLFGVLCAQTYYYSLCFPADRRRLKVFVYGLFILETVQTGMVTQTAFANFGTGWGDLDQLQDPGTLWFTLPFASGLISAAVQSFFAFRIFVLTGSKLLRIVITSTAVISGGAGIATGIVSRLNAHSDSDFQATTKNFTLVCLNFCGKIFADESNQYLLARRRGFIQETTDVISQILRLSVATGLITAAVAAVDLAMFLVYKHNNFHLCPAIFLAKFSSSVPVTVPSLRATLTVKATPQYTLTVF